MKRFAYLAAAATLVCYALLALSEAGRLRHVGAWTLVGCAILLGTHAGGVWLRRPIAWAFAVALLALTGVGYGAYGVRMLYEALTYSRADGWVVLVWFVAVPLGAAIVAAGVASGILAFALVKARDELAEAPRAAWAGALFGAVLSLAELGWLVGYEFHYRQLREQNACAGGRVLSCADLSRKQKKFDLDERRGFALRGCERDHLDSCQELSKMLGVGDVAASPAAKAVAAQCEKGMLGLCKTLGTHLYAIGDAENAGRHLRLACATNANMCSSSAELAAKHGEETIARELLEAGCKVADARSCRAILRQYGASMDAVTRESLEMRTCLFNENFADCRAPMQRDLRATCDRVCESQSRQYFCVLCAREAAKRGEGQYAQGLVEAPCARRYKFACEERGRLQRPPR